MTEKRSQTGGGVEFATATDVGMRRTNNQDSCVASLAADDREWASRGHLFMVADGMGAHAAGELASKMAVDGVTHRYRKYADLAPQEALVKALEETNSEVHRRGNANFEFRNMGTTASALALIPQGAVVAHVGDSRIYRVRGSFIEQLTFDHSLVWELRASGQLPEGAVESGAIPKNVITRSLGPGPQIQVDLEGPYPYELGDLFLICSDGLSGVVTDEEMGAIVGQLAPEEAGQVLIDLANLRGGPDNITVVIVRVTDPSLVESSRTAAPLSSASQSKRAVHPALWLVGALLLASGVLMVRFSQMAAAGVITAALGGLLLAGAAFKSLSGSTSTGRQGMLGRGPYRRHNCPVSQESVEKLEAIVDELRQAAKSAGWTVNWDKFETLSEQAEKAKAAAEYEEALKSLARAVTFMMEELRMQDDTAAGDSSIQY